jgi:hypothetical protein
MQRYYDNNPYIDQNSVEPRELQRSMRYKPSQIFKVTNYSLLPRICLFGRDYIRLGLFE